MLTNAFYTLKTSSGGCSPDITRCEGLKNLQGNVGLPIWSFSRKVVL